MRILVTGAAGFIGGAVCDQLVARGDDVVRLDALIPQAHAGFAEHEHRAGEDLHRLDVRNPEGLHAVLKGVDVVCHQAAMVGAGADVADLPLYAGHNDLGTAVLLAAMALAGVDNLVLASSMVVYGEGAYACPDHGAAPAAPRPVAALDAGCFDHSCPTCGGPLEWRLVEEGTPMDPRSSYAASKAAQEHYASAWTRQVAGRAVALRYHNVYGPRMPRDTPYSGVAAIFRSALEKGEAPRVYEDGQQMRDFVHVDDVARANLAAIDAVAHPAPSGGSDAGGTAGIDFAAFSAFNVCSGRPVAIREVAEILGVESGIAPVVTGQYRIGDVRHVVASPAAATEQLGFSASVTPEEGLRAFVHAPLR